MVSASLCKVCLVAGKEKGREQVSQVERGGGGERERENEWMDGLMNNRLVTTEQILSTDEFLYCYN